MSRTCYIHIGMHKTGSSSIQETLFAIGAFDGACYADINGTANHGGVLLDMYAEHPERNHANVKRGLTMEDMIFRRDRIRERFKASVHSQPLKNLIISGEGISLLSQDALRNLKSDLLVHFSDIKIIGYVRSPKSYMESAFQQGVKGTLSKLSPEDLYPGYRKLFEKFDLVFGKNCVTLRKFDVARFANRCVVRDFCNILGISVSDEQVVRVNEGLSRDAIAMLFAYRKFGPGYGRGWGVLKENQAMISKLSTIEGEKLKFSSMLVDDVIRRHYSDISWIESRIDDSLSESENASGSLVATEDDLFQFSTKGLMDLAALVGEEFNTSVSVVDPRAISAMVHTLRTKSTSRKVIDTQAVGGIDFDFDRLVNSDSKDGSIFLDSSSRLQAKRLLNLAFLRVNLDLKGIDLGRLDVEALGVFSCDQVEVKSSTEASVRKVVRFLSRRARKV